MGNYHARFLGGKAPARAPTYPPHYTGKLIQVGFLTQMRDLIPTLIYSLTMGAIVWTIVQLLPDNILRLSIGIIVGIVYFLAITKLTRSADLRELLSFVKAK